MNKKWIFRITLALDVIFAIVFVLKLTDASKALTRVYYERDSEKASSILYYLDLENYGDAAGLARSGRVGETIDEEDKDVYLLGEYADLLFLETIYAAEGDEEAVLRCGTRRAQIRDEIAEYRAVFDKMDQSIENAVISDH